MVYSEIMDAFPESHIKHAHKLLEQNGEYMTVKRGGTYSNH
jgi:hypothetical protein